MAWTVTSTYIGVDGMLNIIKTNEHGEQWALTAPADIVEIRAAEYGVTPEEALRIVIAEPHIMPPQDTRYTRDDAAVREGYVTTGVEGTDERPVRTYVPIDLYTADTIDEAREAHRLRVAAAEAEAGIAYPRGTIEGILEMVPVDPDALAVREEFRDATREAIRTRTEELLAKADELVLEEGGLTRAELLRRKLGLPPKPETLTPSE